MPFTVEMIIPNYIPEPLEVDRNVTQEPYGERVGFIRRVVVAHFVTLAVAAWAARANWDAVGPTFAAVVLLAATVGVSLIRSLFRGRAIEAGLSAVILPTMIACVAWLGSQAASAGFPVWAPICGSAAMALVVLLSGRDFSFVGSFAISLILSSAAIAAVAVRVSLPVETSALALGLNLAALAYWHYDLAMVLIRRRLGEEWAAVLDLYRDVLNLVGFSIRCVRHWKRHHIWEVAR